MSGACPGTNAPALQSMQTQHRNPTLLSISMGTSHLSLLFYFLISLYYMIFQGVIKQFLHYSTLYAPNNLWTETLHLKWPIHLSQMLLVLQALAHFPLLPSFPLPYLGPKQKCSLYFHVQKLHQGIERAHLQEQKDVVAHPELHFCLWAALSKGTCKPRAELTKTLQTQLGTVTGRGVRSPWGHHHSTLGNIENCSSHLESFLPGSDFQAIQKPHGMGMVLVGIQLGPLLVCYCRAWDTYNWSHISP